MAIVMFASYSLTRFTVNSQPFILGGVEPVDETPPKVENNKLAKLKMLQQLSFQLQMLCQLKKLRQQKQSVSSPSISPDLGYLSSLQKYYTTCMHVSHVSPVGTRM